MSQLPLHGRVALVTGASSGLGVGFARALAQNGAAVALAARREGRLQGLADELRAAGHTALPVRLDVTDSASFGAVLDTIEAELGVVDLLVNNAGISVTATALDTTDEDWDRVLATNLTAPNFKLKAGSPALSGATPSAGFDTSADFMGAMGDVDWTEGWTSFK